MTALPAVNTLVRVAVGDASTLLPSRVEDVEGDEILIAAPAFVGNLDGLSAGDIVSVYWTQARGVCSLPGEYVAEERRGIKLWRLRPAGVMEVVQRRRFARVQTAGAVSVADSGVDTVRVGWIVDLSEGGLRCRLAPGAFEPGSTVECRLTLDGQLVVVPGSVLRSEQAKDGVEEVIVTFADDHAASDRVRKFVFAQQIRERRTAANL